MNIRDFFEMLRKKEPEFQNIEELQQEYQDLDLTVFMEKPQRFSKEMWLFNSPGKNLFEMCGPRISKELAMQMAAEYNWPNTEKSFGPICCYNTGLHTPDNYGVFHLDGKVGLYGSTWKKSASHEKLDAILNLIKNYPSFEFAVFFVRSYRNKPKKEFEIRIQDTEYGFRYDPHKKQLDILEGRSAWKAVRRYQALYTKEERKLFFPEESQAYYEKDAQGKALLLEFAEFEKNHPKSQEGVRVEMSLQQYKESIMTGHEEERSGFFWQDLCEVSEGLELTIFAEDPAYVQFCWLQKSSFVRRPYFEMCGPKISKEKAMEMALAYQWGASEHFNFGLMSCYNEEHHIPDNYGLFKLNGNIGLNGICWKWNHNIEVLCAVLDMAKNYPDFEFAVAISKWNEAPPEAWDVCEYWSTWDYNLQPEDVEVGFAYDPAQKLVKILGPQSAWKTVKRYQAEYTEQERRLFDPDESSRYYSEDPQGKAELAEYVEYSEKNRSKKQKEQQIFPYWEMEQEEEE